MEIELSPTPQYARTLYSFRADDLLCTKERLEDMLGNIEKNLKDICKTKLSGEDFIIVTYSGNAERTNEPREQISKIEGLVILTEEKYKQDALCLFMNHYHNFREEILEKTKNKAGIFNLNFSVTGYIDAKMTISKKWG